MICSKKEIDTIYIFGDSLHDTGNLKKLTNGKFPSEIYFQGRFSNGPMYSEYLADIISEGTGKSIEIKNYAVGGALTKYPNRYLPKALSLQKQIESENFVFKETDLLILGCGGNNYAFCIDFFKFPFIHFNRITNLADDLESCIDKVLAMGAKNIVLFNVPDFFMTPVKYKISSFWRFILPFMSKSVVKTNKKIEGFVSGMRQEGINIEVFDIYKVFKDTMTSPEKFGFKHSKTQIIPGGKQLVENYILEKHEEYLFWDYIHPTTAAHKIISLYLMNLLEEKFEIFSVEAEQKGLL